MSRRATATGIAHRTPASPGLEAPVLEVFASIQGEGLFVGAPQVFLRLRGCPLRCRWCDTPGSWAVAEEPRARLVLSDAVEMHPGWASAFTALTWIARVDPGGSRAVSVTGGEPLLWPEFLLQLRSLCERPLHLETSGADPEALERVLDACDHVSLDLKLPADLDAPVPFEGGAPVPAGGVEWAEVRARALELVRDRDACLKLIVSGGRSRADFLPLLDDAAAIAPELPLVLQPVTALHGVSAPEPELLEALVEAALERRLPFRVLPQVHRALGVR